MERRKDTETGSLVLVLCVPRLKTCLAFYLSFRLSVPLLEFLEVFSLLFFVSYSALLSFLAHWMALEATSWQNYMLE